MLLTLFVVSVAYRPDEGGPGSGCSSGQRDAWRARLLPSTPVGQGQLGGCTTALGPFSIAGACTLTIAAADARSRQLGVEAIDPVKLIIITEADGRRITMQPELKQGERKQIFVGKDQKTIVFRCLTGPTCHVRLE